MNVDKSKLKIGIWYEDKDGNYIGYVANFETTCEEWEGDAE